ncbi:DUF1573 domain-containing protein [Tenacibaculum sp. 190524A05c]|uniref:DUF1573 domain-containing protein n=1 Tax=Tenacibaculum platacis TaxID=3137852 RepID=UPI0032B1042A
MSVAKPTQKEITKYADLVFDTKLIKFDSVKKGKMVSAKYVFSNPSADTLKLDYVNPECICTSYEVSSHVIPPNDKGEITLNLDTTHKIGETKINAVVKANTKTKFYKIILKVNVID